MSDPTAMEADKTKEEMKMATIIKQTKEEINWAEIARSEKMELLAKKTCWAIEKDPKRPGKVKIVDQEHAAELLELANDYLS